MSAPELIVFDLDFTLWDCGGMWIDCTKPPFYLDENGDVRDRDLRKFRLYSDVPDILDSIDCEIGIASRTGEPDWATEVLELMEIRDRFHYEEIYPDSKVTHFEKLHEDSGIPFSNMLFFDDERRNITEVGALGVTCIEVSRGVDWPAFQRGLERINRV